MMTVINCTAAPKIIKKNIAVGAATYINNIAAGDISTVQ
jgi:hypothetical protein